MSVVVCEKPVAPEATSRYCISFYRPLCAPADGLSERVDIEPPLREGSVNVVQFVRFRAAMQRSGLACDEKEAVVCMRNE